MVRARSAEGERTARSGPALVSYDALIIGGGHNGLACAAYLARAGLRVRLFEARGIIGGAAVTEEFHPGYRNSSCSYVVSVLDQRVQKDLELARHGLRIIALKQEMTVSGEDGRAIAVGPDRDALMRQLDALAPGDGAAYERFEALLTEVADVVREVARGTPPNLRGGAGAISSPRSARARPHASSAHRHASSLRN